MSFNRLIIIFILLLTPIYFLLDRELFYFGKQDFSFYNLLPFNFEPDSRHDFEGGFCIADDGFTMIGQGLVFWSSPSVTINEVLSYGFNQESVIALVEAKDGCKYYVEYIKNPNFESKMDLKVNVWSNNENLKIDKYHWIEIKNQNKQTKLMELSRNYISLIIICLFLALFIKSFKRRKGINSQNNSIITS